MPRRGVLVGATAGAICLSACAARPAALEQSAVTRSPDPSTVAAAQRVPPLLTEPTPAGPTRDQLQQASVSPGSMVPVLRQVPTTDDVAFITIDDGWVRDATDVQLVADAHVPLTVFPISDAAAQEPLFFTALARSAGAPLHFEDHTVTHPDLPVEAFDRQAWQICHARLLDSSLLGTTPVLFRPPYGAFDTATVDAAAGCGMRAVVLWAAATNKGHVKNARGRVSATNPLQPGDIVLMHFRDTFAEDFAASVRAVEDSGLRVASLEDYLSALPPQPVTLAPAAPPDLLRHP